MPDFLKEARYKKTILLIGVQYFLKPNNKYYLLANN